MRLANPSDTTKGYSQYGASMGRRSDKQLVGRVHLRKVPIDRQGYDRGGAYWGVGAPLYVAYDDEGNEIFFRAEGREAAKKHAATLVAKENPLSSTSKFLLWGAAYGVVAGALYYWIAKPAAPTTSTVATDANTPLVTKIPTS